MPKQPNTLGLESEVATKLMAQYSEAVGIWRSYIDRIHDQIQSALCKPCEAQVEFSPLQNTDLPAALEKPRMIESIRSGNSRRYLRKCPRSLRLSDFFPPVEEQAYVV